MLVMADERDGLEFTLPIALGMLGAVAMGIGTLGPWIRVTAGVLAAHDTGTDRNLGVATLGFAFALLLVVAFSAQVRAPQWFAWVALALAVAEARAARCGKR